MNAKRKKVTDYILKTFKSIDKSGNNYKFYKDYFDGLTEPLCDISE